MKPARNHPGYWAFIVHRISGIGLVLFLPVHFVVLAKVIEGTAALDAFLDWTQSPAVKLVEMVLVMLLAAHLVGGVRILLIEFAPWREGFNNFISLTAGVSLALALMFGLALL